MRRAAYEVVGLGLVLAGLYFFWESVAFFSGRDYVAGVLEIFVGLAVTRAGLELVKLGLLLIPQPSLPVRTPDLDLGRDDAEPRSP